MLTKIGKELKTGVRTLWSQDRRRIKWGELDLDLSYIGEDVIAMALPGYGSLMATIRNSDEEYAAYLNHHHKGHYRIWNLSEMNYDIGKFDVNSVVDAGWPDHHNPPLALAFIHLDRMFHYLKQDPQNKVVVHCVAGKGRTGCLIAMLMLYRNQCVEAKEALLRFARARLEEEDIPRISVLGDGSDIGGVRNPSQIRYVEYVAQLLHGNYPLPKHPIALLRLEIRNAVKDMAPPYVVVSRYDSGKEEELFTSEPGSVSISSVNALNSYSTNERKNTDGCVSIGLNRLLEQGDYVIRVKHGGFVGELLATTVAWVGFHTAMLWPSPPQKSSAWRLPKSQLDHAFKSNKVSLPEEFEISIIYQTEYAETVPPVEWNPLLQRRTEYFDVLRRRSSNNTSSPQTAPMSESSSYPATSSSRSSSSYSPSAPSSTRSSLSSSTRSSASSSSSTSPSCPRSSISSSCSSSAATSYASVARTSDASFSTIPSSLSRLSASSPPSTESGGTTIISNTVPLEDFLSGSVLSPSRTSSSPSSQSGSFSTRPSSSVSPASSSAFLASSPPVRHSRSSSLTLSPPPVPSSFSPSAYDAMSSLPSSTSQSRSSCSGMDAQRRSSMSSSLESCSGSRQSASSSGAYQGSINSRLEDWSCLKCTFLNSKLLPFCEMCSQPRLL